MAAAFQKIEGLERRGVYHQSDSQEIRSAYMGVYWMSNHLRYYRVIAKTSIGE